MAEAEALQAETLAIQREELGPEHPDTLLSIGNMARILGKRGRVDEAERLLKEVLEVQRPQVRAAVSRRGGIDVRARLPRGAR